MNHQLQTNSFWNWKTRSSTGNMFALRLRCDTRFQRVFTACSCVFEVIALFWINQLNYFKNATSCSKRNSAQGMIWWLHLRLEAISTKIRHALKVGKIDPKISFISQNLVQNVLRLTMLTGQYGYQMWSNFFQIISYTKPFRCLTKMFLNLNS